MLGILKNAFLLTNKNIGLLCLLMAFSLATTLFISRFETITSQVIVLYTLILTAFFSGFFHIIKNLVSGEDKKISFLEGVGDYFLPMLGIWLITLGFYISSAVTSMLITLNIVGTKEQINVAMNEILSTMQPNSQTAIANLSPETIKIYLSVILTLWIVWGILSFIIIYWIPVLFIDNERNIFKSFIIGIKTLFKNFAKTLGVFSILIIFAIITSIASALAAKISPAIEFIFFALTYYLGVAFSFAIFLLYKNR